MITVSPKATRPRVQYGPRGFRRARNSFDHGDPRALIEMMHEATVDSFVDGCVGGRIMGFKRDWMLKPTDDSTEAQERVDFFTEWLEGIHFSDLAEAIYDGRLYSYSVIDLIWDVQSGYQLPVDWRQIGWEKFTYPTKTMSDLRIDFGGGDLREIPDTALVVDESRRARRRPVLITVLRDWILKEFGLEAFAAFIESFGEPFILGTYPAGMSDNDGFKDEVEEAVESIARSSRGIAPEGTDLTIKESGRATLDHGRFLTEAKEGISLTLLGHVNAVKNDGGVNVGGTDTQYKVRQDYAVGDMEWLESPINGLLQMIAVRNFSDGRAPTFAFRKPDQVGRQDLLDALDLAYQHGLELKGSDYRRLGIDVDPDARTQKPSTGLDLLD